MSKWNLVVFCPAYNVEKTMGELAARTAGAVPGLLQEGVALRHMIVVDDGSTDGTDGILSGLKKKFQFLRLVHKEKNEGPAKAVLDGMQEAAKLVRSEKLPLKRTIVVRMDSDLEHQPEDILKVIAPIVSGSCNVSFGYLPVDSRNGILASWFSRSVGIWESREFLGLDVPQFAPGFNAARADIFLPLFLKMQKAAEKFRLRTGKEMVTVDFVYLNAAKRMGQKLTAVQLLPIEGKWIKKIPASKIFSYFHYHHITSKLLREEGFLG